MNDLLASLVDRALDRTPVLQRRQPTLFEPIAEASFSEQSQSKTPPLEEEEIVVESKPPLERQKLSINNPSPLVQPSLRREEQEPVETRPIRPRRVDDNPPPQNDRVNAPLEPVSTVSRKVEAIRLEEPRRELRTPIVAKPEEITVAPKRLIETIVERRVEREVIKEHAADQPAIKEVHAFTKPISPPKSNDKDSQPKPALKVETKRPATPKEETTIKPLKQRPEPRRDVPPYIRAVARAESRNSSKQETPPVIHVTIGRVEVRATPAATGKTRIARTAGPKMTLDDYLSSRSKGNQ